VTSVRRLILFVLLLGFGLAQARDDMDDEQIDTIVVLATPVTSEPLPLVFIPDCGEVGEICDYFSKDVVTAEVDTVVAGSLSAGSFRSAINSLPVRLASETGLHLFVLRRSRDDTAKQFDYRYDVIEAYPAPGEVVCTARSLERYASPLFVGADERPIDVAPERRTYCYRTEDLRAAPGNCEFYMASGSSLSASISANSSHCGILRLLG